MQVSAQVLRENKIREMALQTLQESSVLLNRQYLPELEHYRIIPTPDSLVLASDVRLFAIERIVFENKQAVLESLTAAYTALGVAGFAVFFVLDSDGVQTKLYIGTRGKPNRAQGQTAGNLLEQTFKGHFSGSLLHNLKNPDIQKLLNSLYQENQDGASNVQAVTAVTGVPSLAIEDSREHFMQGLERFIDAAEGKVYKAVILAEPVDSQQLAQIRLHLENVSTQISPLLKQQISFGKNESDSVSLALGNSISESVGESVGRSISETFTYGANNTTAHGTNTSTAKNSGFSLGLGGVGATIGFLMGGPIGMGLGTLIGSNVNVSKSTTHNAGSNFSQTNGVSQSFTYGTTSTNTQTNTQTSGSSQSYTHGITQGMSQQITLEATNKHIEQMLQKIDQYLERINEAERYGAWQSAAYFIGSNRAETESLASIFLGLMRGNRSNNEPFALNTWDKSSGKTKDVVRWLQQLSHPQFKPYGFQRISLPVLTPSSLISGKEMAVQFSLPRRSTSGTSVLQSQSFGRRVQNLDGHTDIGSDNLKIKLGKVHHLWQSLNQDVQLNLNDLSSHVFVSGSTGSGKSNVIYGLLDKAQQHNIPFLVIEPAKGEYKHIFGNRENVRVFSTNLSQSELLKINPFKFSDGIHVLEHIDRLVEIFNVCWAMYAAMPAVLKDAMLRAYERTGWNLDDSINVVSDELFPTFMDLLSALREVIDESDFSQEIKSNYTGALITRVKSLTNGLNKQIFTTNEIDNTILFDSNVIVDLSRVGSQETRSLIMGILVMRLSEYRMSQSGMNLPLKHLTVLEEAHNILKRTSTEQNSESANVTGKAVEMLSNAIAEMRTYGEGFVIADQSPNAVDISVIRNTNTKIIMRLPDEIDRRLAGKSAGLKDEQLDELSKLPKGVAVIYQNNWLEPVLCQIDYFSVGSKYNIYQYVQKTTNHFVNRKNFNLFVCRLLLEKMSGEKEKVDCDVIHQGLKIFELSGVLRYQILSILNKQSVEIFRRPERISTSVLELLELNEIAAQITKKYFLGEHVVLNEYSLSNWANELFIEIQSRLNHNATLDTYLSVLKCCIYQSNHTTLLIIFDKQKEMLRDMLGE